MKISHTFPFILQEKRVEEHLAFSQSQEVFDSRWEIGQKLGEGRTHVVVYRGRNRMTGRPVAVKKCDKMTSRYSAREDRDEVNNILQIMRVALINHFFHF